MKNNLRSFGVAQALAVGICLGLVMSSVSCGNRPPIAKCNRNTCDGCCDDTGTCFSPTDAGLQSPEACGLGGVTCEVCPTSQLCVDGQCRVGGMGGGSGGGGGASGGTGGSAGDGGVPCNATSCANGCCTSGGTCVGPAMQNFTRCGSGGVLCTGCPNGQSCQAGDAGVNRCAVPQCSTCLDTAGNCRPAVDDNYCGGNGGVCARCDTTNGQHCQNGRCVGMQGCTAANCDGCCSGSACIPLDGGVSNAQCGRMASACTTCTSPATCDLGTGTCVGGGGTGGGGGTFPFPDGGLTVCDMTTCPTGCCDFALGCLQNGMDYGGAGFAQACGSGGNVCKICIPDCASGMAIGFCF